MRSRCGNPPSRGRRRNPPTRRAPPTASTGRHYGQRSAGPSRRTAVGGSRHKPSDSGRLAAANGEITELRRKLTRLGSVNLDALRELAELDERAKTLQGQFADLSGAQRSLQEIIDKIDGDSRKLFTEAFEAIRGHFQELFRKL